VGHDWSKDPGTNSEEQGDILARVHGGENYCGPKKEKKLNCRKARGNLVVPITTPGQGSGNGCGRDRGAKTRGEKTERNA